MNVDFSKHADNIKLVPIFKMSEGQNYLRIVLVISFLTAYFYRRREEGGSEHPPPPVHSRIDDVT